MREVGHSIRVATEKPSIKLEAIAELAVPVSPISIAAAPGVLYLSAAGFGFMTVDMANPSAPKLSSTYEGIVAPKDPRSRFFLSVLPDPESKRIFVLDRLHGLCEWDATNPLAPVLHRNLDLGQDVNSQALLMRKIGGYYYLPAGGAGLLRIHEGLNSKPEVEKLLSAFDHTRDVSFFPPHWLLVADGHDSGMQIVDISDEKNPSLAHVFNVMTYCDQVIPLKGYALMASRGLGMVAVEMSDPSQPFVSRIYLPPVQSELKTMTIWRDRYVITSGGTPEYGAAAKGYIQIYDMNAPEDAVLEVSFKTDAEINALALTGDYLVANLWQQNRIIIYQLSET